MMLAAAPVLHATTVHHGICATRSAQLLDAVANRDYTAANKYLNPTLAKSLTSERIASSWTAVQRAHGAYRHHDVPVRRVVDGQHFIFTQAWFAKGPLNNVTRCDPDGKIAFSDWLFDAAGTIKSAVPHTFADGVHTLPLAVNSPYGPLPAELTLPPGAGPFPAAVMIVGSGEQDMNEQVGPNEPFRDLALGLAKLGVATLRYDKRIYAYRLEASLDKTLTVDQDVTDDALTAVKLLASQPGIDAHQIFVLGHSEGAMLAPRIAERDRQVAGLVLLGAPAVPVLQKAIREMGHRAKREKEPAVKAQLLAAVASARHELALVEHASPQHPLSGTFQGMPQTWWITLQNVHPVAAVKQLHIPVLILQGGADRTVSPKYSFSRWQKAFSQSTRVTLKLYPGLDHAFLPVDLSLPRGADAAPRHVPLEVISDIAAWIKAKSAR